MPLGLYGVAAAPVSGTALNKLRCAVAKAADPRAFRTRSLDLMLMLGLDRNVDPRAWVWVSRVVAVR
eukprot:3316813-Alexandrium_andersonii.AAC.1